MIFSIFSNIATKVFALVLALFTVGVLILGVIYYTKENTKPSFVENSRFGKIAIFGKKNVDGKLVIYLSSADVPTRPEFLNGLIGRGEMVAHVNLRSYLDRAKTENMTGESPCYEFAGEIARLSQVLQNKLKMRNIDKAVLIGDGNLSSSFVFSVQEYLRTDFFVAFSLFPSDQVAKTDLLCQDEGLKKMFTGKTLAVSSLSKTKSKEALQNWIYNVSGQSSPALVSGTNEVDPSFLTCKQNACPLVEKFLPKEDSQIASFPLIEEIPQEIKTDYFVLFLSGDGGWANIDKEIGNSLNTLGIPVIGFDSLRYFWGKKSPNRMTNDVQGILKSYKKKFNMEKVVLVGFSLGANALPFILSRLPEADRSSIVHTILLSPTQRTDFEVNFSDWLPIREQVKGEAVLDEVLKINNISGLCILGEDDDDSLCTQKIPSWLRIQKVPGSHHFNGDYKKVSDIILGELLGRAQSDTK